MKLGKIQQPARALRNSDYASPDTKIDMLSLIVTSSELIGKVLFVLSNTLARSRSAEYEGIRFTLADSFQGSQEKIVEQIIRFIPFNVNKHYANDLYSPKMSKLLIEQVANEISAFRKHQLIRVIVSKYPTGWEKVIDEYIEGMEKNEFYLLDLYNALTHEYRYSYTSARNIKSLGNHLKKIGLVAGLLYKENSRGKRKKIEVKKPGSKAIRNVPDRFLPKRDIDDEASS